MATKTKEKIVLKALRRAGLASNAMLLAPEPESVADGLEDLEDMIAKWEGEGIVLGYRYAANPDQPQPSEESGLPDWAVDPVIHNLALRMCIDNQRPIPAKLDTLAYNEKITLESRMVAVPTLQRRGDMPKGAGYGGGINPFGRNRFYNEHDTLQDDNGQSFDFD